MRVAMVTPRFLPHIGGVETHVGEVAARMVASGVDVSVLTLDPGGRLPPVECQHGVMVRRFPATPSSTDLSVSLALTAAATTGAYDLVHVQGVHTLLAPTALYAAQRAGIPTVVTFHTGGHSSRVRNALRGSQWRSLRPLLRRASRLIAVCKYEVSLFARLLGVDRGAIRLIRNGADPLPVADTGPEISGSPLICSVGRLERYKGHHRLIAAMPPILEANPGAHLAVVGRGPYERPLRRLAARLGVRSAVSFTAFESTRRAALGALMASSDVVALISDYEAHPLSVMEALGLGRNVVVAATSGLTELASAGLATAVSPGAPPAVLAGVLAKVATEPPGARPELPSWGDCVDSTLDVYAEVTHTGWPAGPALDGDHWDHGLAG